MRAAGRFRAAVAVAAAMVGALAPTYQAAGQSPEERRVEEAAAALESLRAQTERAEAERDEDADALAAAERRLAEVEDAVAQAEQAVQRQQRAVLTAAERLDELQRGERRRRSAYVARVVEQYKQRPSALEAVLGSRSLGDALRASRYLDAMARSDRSTLEQLHADAVSVDAQRRELAAQEEALERVAAKKRVLLADAQKLRQSRALRLARTQGRVGKLEERERIAEAESRQVAAITQRAARPPAPSRSNGTPSSSGPVSTDGGGWVWPTSGPVTSEFGPRWGRMHEGIDIGAPTGAPIYASSSGVVSFAGSMGGYGQLTLVDHGNGVVTAYAHQSRLGVSPGQRVTAGQVIGAIGATGNVTGPHLHFETRAGGGTPRNPRLYLP